MYVIHLYRQAQLYLYIYIYIYIYIYTFQAHVLKYPTVRLHSRNY
jgi:hypothetical protein